MALFFTTTLLFWYKNGLVKGVAEPGAPFLFPNNAFNEYFYTWIKDGLGQFVLSRNSILPVIFIAKALNLFMPNYLAQAIVFFATSFLSSCFLFGYLKLFNKDENEEADWRDYAVYVVALLFYNLNLIAINFWNRFQLPATFMYFFIPIAIYFFELIIFRLSEKTKIFKALLSFLFLSLFFSYSFENPAFAVSLWVFLFSYFILRLFILREKYLLRIKKFMLFFLAWVIANSWFLLPYASATMNSLTSTLSGGGEDFNDGTYRLVSEEYGRLSNLFVGHITWLDGNLSHLSIKINYIGIALFGSLIIALIIFFLKNKISKNKLFFFSLFLLFITMSSGTRAGSLGAVNKILFDNLFIFKAFRNPVEKIGIYLSLLFTIIIFLSLVSIRRKRFFNIVLALLLIPMLYSSYFVITGRILSTAKAERLHDNYDIKPPAEYFDFISKVDAQKLDKRFLILPLGRLEMATHNWEYGYNGRELFNSFSNKTMVSSATWFALQDLTIRLVYNAKNCDELKKGAYIMGIKNIFYFKDIDITTLVNQKLSPYEKAKCISPPDQWKCNEIYCELALNSNDDSFFLPHFYISQGSVITNRSVEDFPSILSGNDRQIRSAIFFREQNAEKDKILSKISDKNPASKNQTQSIQENNLPVLEFKKINPIKYRIQIHNAKGNIPLVFLEGFDKGWKIYLNQNANLKMKNDNLKLKIDNYKILNGNNEDQATASELQNYINSGFVTTLGDLREKTIEHKKWEDPEKPDGHGASGKEKLDYVEKYNIDFISKNFQGTIQNDNLPDGKFYETWFQTPIENNDNHLIANGYANSWVIDTEKICGLDSRLRGNDNISCVRNPDGSYDFEIIVEFWPQRLFYLGIGISGMTLLACLGYLGYAWRRKWVSLQD